MCLYPYWKRTNKTPRKGVVTCYKVVRFTPRTLRSYYYSFNWKPGLNEARMSQAARKRPQLDTLDEGIHVYTSLSHARKAQRYYLVGTVILPVQCNQRDLVAYSYKSAEQGLFTKVRVLKKDYIRALKGINP